MARFPLRSQQVDGLGLGLVQIRLPNYNLVISVAKGACRSPKTICISHISHISQVGSAHPLASPAKVAAPRLELLLPAQCFIATSPKDREQSLRPPHLKRRFGRSAVPTPGMSGQEHN